jgi:hypothetical protein
MLVIPIMLMHEKFGRGCNSNFFLAGIRICITSRLQNFVHMLTQRRIFLTRMLFYFTGYGGLPSISEDL